MEGSGTLEDQLEATKVGCNTFTVKQEYYEHTYCKFMIVT